MTSLERLAHLREIERYVVFIDVSLCGQLDRESKNAALEKLAEMIDLRG